VLFPLSFSLPSSILPKLAIQVPLFGFPFLPKHLSPLFALLSRLAYL